VRRSALPVSLVIVASALSIPLAASPALAAAPVEKAFVVADIDGDGQSGLYLQAMSDGSRTTVVADDTINFTVDVSDVSTSADGSRVAYVQDSYDAVTSAPLREKVIVRDVSTRIVRVVSDISMNGSAFDFLPALSPDGSTVVWSRVTFGTTVTLSTMKAAVAGGPTSTLKTGYAGGVFLNSSTLMVRDEPGNWYTTSAVSPGAVTAVTGLTLHDGEPIVSPDGTHLAWSLDTTGTGDSTADVQVGTPQLTGSALTVTGTTTVATGGNNVTTTFSQDSGKVYFVRNDGNVGPGDLWTAASAATDTTTAALVGTTTADEHDVAVAWTDDGTAPGAATSKPAVLNGTSATLGWTLPADADLSGTYITRTLNGGSAKNIYVPAPLTSYVDTGLTLGATYSYAFKAIDRSGHAGVSAERSLTALQAAPTFADPTSTTSVKALFPVTFGPANGTFVVDFLPDGYTSWQHWVTGATGRIRNFGVPGTTGVNATTSTAGRSYSFRVMAKDAYGNATAWVGSARAVVPYDQTKATLYGGSNVYSSSAFMGSYRRLSKTSDYAKVTLVGNRLQIVGIKCAACGAFTVYEFNPADGSGSYVTIDTHASSTKVRQVLYLRYLPANSTRVFTIRPKATSGRPYVMLDGFAMRR
jgi:hypothetical protein